MHTVSQCGGGRVIDHSFDDESSQLRGPLGCLTLQIVEVSRNGNDSSIDGISEAQFGVCFKFLQDQARDLLRLQYQLTDLKYGATALGLNRKRELFLIRFSRPSPDQTFGGVDGA